MERKKRGLDANLVLITNDSDRVLAHGTKRLRHTRAQSSGKRGSCMKLTIESMTATTSTYVPPMASMVPYELIASAGAESQSASKSTDELNSLEETKATATKPCNSSIGVPMKEQSLLTHKLVLSRIRGLQLQEERMRLEHYRLSQLWDFHCHRMTDTGNEINDAIESATQLLTSDSSTVMDAGFDESAKQLHAAIEFGIRM
ncbi:hypothetical protein PI125_g7422 [Phytophthora idaei]|nr:hypothetical protein PI125_g7422 [Phytophthora idaei]